MHFHLAKPLHGWREFAGEIAIIVIGVLIALGAERVMEHFRDEARGHEASQNVRAEIGASIGAEMSRAPTEHCIKRRIEEIQTYVDEVAGGGVPTRPSWVGRPQVWTIGRARWQAATYTDGIQKSGMSDVGEPQ